MARTKKFIILIISFVLVVSGTAGVAFGLQTTQIKKLTLSQLESDCIRSIDQDGFGHAVIDGGLIQKQTGQLTIPCKIKLLPGSTLRLNQVQLTSQNLLIENGDPNENPVHLHINQSSLKSSNGGFQIKYTSNKSTVVIEGSQFDYPLSIGAAVGQKDNDKAVVLEASNSSFTSTGNSSEGILMVSTGKTIFAHNQFQLNKPDDTALLIGLTCVLTKNTHANDRCHGP